MKIKNGKTILIGMLSTIVFSLVVFNFLSNSKPSNINKKTLSLLDKDISDDDLKAWAKRINKQVYENINKEKKLMERKVIEKRLDYGDKIGKSTDLYAWKKYLEKKQEKVDEWTNMLNSVEEFWTVENDEHYSNSNNDTDAESSISNLESEAKQDEYNEDSSKTDKSEKKENSIGEKNEEEYTSLIHRTESKKPVKKKGNYLLNIKDKVLNKTNSDQKKSNGIHYLLIILSILSIAAIGIIAYEIKQNISISNKLKTLEIPTDDIISKSDYNLLDETKLDMDEISVINN